MNTKISRFSIRGVLLLLSLIVLNSIAGAQWQKQTVDTKASLRGLSVVNEKIVWASGTGGSFLRTIDGGKTWKVGKVPDAEKLDFRDVEAFDANTAYLLSIGEGENSRIYKTTDGGETWKLQFKNSNPKAFFDAFDFWDANNGIAMSDPVDGKYLLIATTDGGQTWKQLPNDKMPSAKEGEAAFAASGTCIIVNGKSDVFLVTGGQAARVFYSQNRGASWSIADTPIISGANGTGIFSIAMFDNKSGVIVGGNYEKPNESANNLALTNDGGKTWILGKGLNGYRSGVAFVDKNTLVAVGSSGSDISRDGGQTWTNLDRENYNAVVAKGKNAVWAVGANGLVARYFIPKK
ncbi:MAG: glycosyl hydrolase [Acidobacteriota bacterium]|nr:glycosyl hydrolase [Acidobacteriota bacterium]